MSNYYLIFIWIIAFGILESKKQMKQVENVGEKRTERMKPFWAGILVLPLVLWAGYRENVIDTGEYMKMFSEMPETFSEIFLYMKGIEKDKGFYFISAIIKAVIGNNVNIYFLIIAALQAYFLFRIYRKYSTRFVISFFLFIASTDYISWMFNGMRQFLAVTIVFSAFEYVLKKNYVKSIIIVLAASLVHGSALLMIPFIFIVQGKAWNKKTILFILATIVAVIYIEQFTNILDGLLQETQYENVVTAWQVGEDDGTNMIRVVVYAIPTVLSLVGLKYIKAKDSNIINLCTNMSIVSTGIYIISMFTSGIYIGRLPIYFSLYNYILLPWEIENMFEKKSAIIMYIMMAGAYLMFYLYQVRVAWGII